MTFNPRPVLMAALVASVTSLAHGGNVVAASASPSATMSATVSGAIDLDGAIARLGDAQATVRKATTEQLATTSAEALPLLEARLLRAPEGGTGAAYLVLERARKAIGKQSSDDAIEPLLAWVIDQTPTAGTRTLSLWLAGMTACERLHGVVGARVLVKLATEQKGVVRREATATLKRLGDGAVAALVEVRRDPDKDVRALANRLLDGMGKFLPSDAVQVKEPQQLAEVLIAFGKLKDPDAVRAVIPYLNADRALVRDAARWSIAQFGADARGPLVETFDSFTSEKAGDDWTADRVLKELLSAYDKVRLADVFKLFDQGVAARDAGKLEDAARAFDGLLARAPTFERRAELAPTYFDLGKAALRADRADRTAARALFVKASRLAQGTPLARTIDAELTFVDALDAYDRGVVDTTLLHRVLLLDPNHVDAAALLARAQSDAESRESKLRRMAAAAGAGLVAMIAAILFLGRRRKAPPPPPRPRHGRPVRI